MQNTKKQILQTRVSDDTAESYTPQQYKELQAKLTQLDLTNQRLKLQVHQLTEQLENSARTIDQMKQERVETEKELTDCRAETQRLRSLAQSQSQNFSPARVVQRQEDKAQPTSHTDLDVCELEQSNQKQRAQIQSLFSQNKQLLRQLQQNQRRFAESQAKSRPGKEQEDIGILKLEYQLLSEKLDKQVRENKILTQKLSMASSATELHRAQARQQTVTLNKSLQLQSESPFVSPRARRKLRKVVAQ